MTVGVVVIVGVKVGVMVVGPMGVCEGVHVNGTFGTSVVGISGVLVVGGKSNL